MLGNINTPVACNSVKVNVHQAPHAVLPQLSLTVSCISMQDLQVAMRHQAVRTAAFQCTFMCTACFFPSIMLDSALPYADNSVSLLTLKAVSAGHQ